MRKVRFETEDGRLVCIAEVADTFLTRLCGLLGRRELADGEGLWLKPCRSVHTIGLRFPIDVIHLNRDSVVTKVDVRLRPHRVSKGPRRTASVLELYARTAARLGIEVGDSMVCHEAGE